MVSTILDNTYELCEIINRSSKEKLFAYKEVVDTFINVLREQEEDLIKKVIEIFSKSKSDKNSYAYIFLQSIIINITLDEKELVDLEEYVIENEELDAGTKHFLFYQIKSLMFCNKKLTTENTVLLKWKLFEQIVGLYKRLIHTELKYIPRNERNHSIVLVVTEQFLTTEHGPTKTALDRCKTLINKMKKEVVLIDTAEYGNFYSNCPFYNALYGTYIQQNSELQEVEWKDVTVPYVQCENNMPNPESIEALLETVYTLKPEHIVMIGGNSIFANLADEIIPVLAVGLSPSAMENTMVSYQTLSRKLSDEDIRILHAMGKSEDSVIYSVFTSGLKEQTEHITRKELGIEEKCFVMAVIGARLDAEVTESFCDMLEEVLEDGMQVVFIGRFEKYYEINEKKYPNLKKYSKYLGFCSDILSRLECCDLYVNPIRSGGGTSSVEALYKGIPVVTTEYGDVATNVGEAFWVKDYEEMKLRIKQYRYDIDYYHRQSKYALEKVKGLLDTDGEFVRIISEMEYRELRRISF